MCAKQYIIVNSTNKAVRTIKVTPLVYQFLMHSREIFHSYSLQHVRRMHCETSFWKHKFYLKLDDCLSRLELCLNEFRRIHSHKCRYSVYPYGGLEAFTNIASGFRCLWCLSKPFKLRQTAQKYIGTHLLIWLQNGEGSLPINRFLSLSCLCLARCLLVWK